MQSRGHNDPLTACVVAETCFVTEKTSEIIGLMHTLRKCIFSKETQSTRVYFFNLFSILLGYTWYIF